MKNTLVKSIAFLLLFVGTFLSHRLAFCAATAEANAEIAKFKPVTVEHAFALSVLKFGDSNEHVSVQPGRLPLVTLGTTNLLAIPIENEGGNSRRIKIHSFVVAVGENKYGMFYPVISLVDNNFLVYKTIRPAQEFAFDGSALTNDFEIPRGAERILVHSHEEFFRSDFVAHTYVAGPSASDYVMLSLLAGPIGDLIFKAIANRAASNEPKEFSFSEVGEIVIRPVDPGGDK